jgi:circadian clock protein KaiC
MKPARSPGPASNGKAATGITGFDGISGGGLPQGRSTLLLGGPGSGKTVFGLQFLVHGAQACQEPGIFVAFEETAARIVINAQSFDWHLDSLQPGQLFFLDAQPQPDRLHAGDFDLGGMLAALQAQVDTMKARRIVFDALDIMLDLLPDAAARQREIYRLHDWLLAHGLSAIITAKTHDDNDAAQPMQFMMDCVVILRHSVVLGVSQRNLRVQKYRGSGFDENESPFLIGAHGLEVPMARSPRSADAQVSSERISSGVARLDTMLGGGYYRAASVLITGFSGTAKTTLSGAFAAAACERGERSLFVSFDSDCAEVIRNLASVGLQLEPHVKSGLLRMVSARSISGSAETYLLRIKALAGEQRARCLIVDPMSTWSKSGKDLTAHSVADRLMDWAKGEGLTLVCTSLLDEISSLPEDGSPLQISTLADTWIHLNYLVQAGERNRGLAIIKSRGTAHSNQVRELILSSAGVTLADTYSVNGEVLMGTLRWEKESLERAASERAEVAATLEHVRLQAQQQRLQQRLAALQAELLAKQEEMELLKRSSAKRLAELAQRHRQIATLRGADAADAAEPASPS